MYKLLFIFIFCFHVVGAENSILFIVNPKSGVENNGNMGSLIKQYFDESEYRIVYTEHQNHATALSREAAQQGFEIVVAVGGDGTINEVGKGLIGSDIAMGIIPTGSGNGLARHLNIPMNPPDALKLLKQAKPQVIDTVTINEEVFLGVAGVGFDAHIAEKFSKSKRRGFLSYCAYVLQDYTHFKPREYELIIDGMVMKRRALLVSFANSSQYGNNMVIAPMAKLDDGYLQVAIMKKPPVYALPTVLYHLANSSIDRSKYFEVIKAKELTLVGQHHLTHIDGEPMSFEGDIQLKVNPHSLTVLVPHSKVAG